MADLNILDLLDDLRNENQPGYTPKYLNKLGVNNIPVVQESFAQLFQMLQDQGRGTRASEASLNNQVAASLAGIQAPPGGSSDAIAAAQAAATLGRNLDAARSVAADSRMRSDIGLFGNLAIEPAVATRAGDVQGQEYALRISNAQDNQRNLLWQQIGGILNSAASLSDQIAAGRKPKKGGSSGSGVFSV